MIIRTAPMTHQADAVAKLLPSRVGAFFMDMGTGKSLALLMLAAARKDKFDRLFWITPCALRENVRREIIKHTDEKSICVWDSTTLDNIPDSRIHIVGVETISSSDRAVLAFDQLVTERSFVATDESTTIKNSQCKRAKRIITLSARCRYRAILTGTPITQGEQDLYGQFTFLSPKILGYKSWWAFSQNHLVYREVRDGSGRKVKTGHITRSHDVEYLMGRIAPYVYQVRKDDCLDLPEKRWQDRWTTLTREQRQAYDAAKEEILALDYDDWSPIAIFHLFTSLQTICCGFWKKADGEVIYLDENRTDLTCQIASEMRGHVIIWCKYRFCVERISQRLNERHGDGSAKMYYGDMGETEREASLQAWRYNGGFLCATQAIGGIGLTLTESCNTIFHADSFKYSERLQAEDRTHRIGQDENPLYISVGCSGSIDERINGALAEKQSALERFQKGVEQCKSQGMKDRARRMVEAL